jgi:hypothetical protein
MEKLTRRKLITQASVGTGAAGILAITAACAPSGKATSSTNTPASPSATPGHTIDEPLAVFVTDPAKGTLKIMKGDREIIINNPDLANNLLALVK